MNEGRKRARRSPDWAEQTVDDDGDLADAAGLEAMPCLVIIHGPDTGRRIVLERGDLVIGRCEPADIVIEDERISSAHCVLKVSGQTVYVRDSGSRNGTFVDGTRVDEAALEPNAQLRVGRTVLRLDLRAEAEIRHEEALFAAATLDPLTQIPNRRMFMQEAQSHLAQARRYDRALSVVMLDVDWFKRINDTYGHACGDHVLVTLAGVLCDSKREGDLVCRYGGEEFVFLLPDTTGNDALQFADRVRKAVAEKPIRYGAQTLSVTISLGVSELRGQESLEAGIVRADQALYAAKEKGRNRVENAPQDGAGGSKPSTETHPG